MGKMGTKEEEKLYSLLRINQEILSQGDLNQLLQHIVTSGVKFLQVDAGTLRLADSEKTSLLLKAAVGTSRSPHCLVLSLNKNSIAGRSFLERTSFFCSDISKEPLYPWNSQEIGKFTSLLTVPLKTKDEVLGVLSLYSKKRRNFSSFEVRLAELFASQAALAIVTRSYIEKIHKLAIMEGLTGLYNQSYFYQRLEEELARASRSKYPLSILFMDVDGLKDINDTRGHLTGDKVLKLIARNIKSNIRKMDIAFRYGGDEFVVILPQADQDKAFLVAERIREKIKKMPFSLGLSIGIASFPQDAKKLRELLDKADQAMYQAKQKGGNRVEKLPPKHRD
jgi:diguanylate cyclase (GGDEF)-like protein